MKKHVNVILTKDKFKVEFKYIVVSVLVIRLDCVGFESWSSTSVVVRNQP